MRPPMDAMEEISGEEGLFIATSSATYFQTKAGKISQRPAISKRMMLKKMVVRQGTSRPMSRRKIGPVGREGGLGVAALTAVGMGMILWGAG